MNDPTEAARKANATRKALNLNLTTTEARKLSPQMKQLIKALAEIGINHHSSVEGEWVVADVAGVSRVITVFTTSDEYIDFNFDPEGNFTYVFIGTTETDNEVCPTCGNSKNSESKEEDPVTAVS
jgi:hypothetical protein